MKHDRQIHISTAGTRRATLWPASRLMWSELCEKLKTPVRSQESLDSYLGMTKSQQSELKDVGGFVAGTLKNNRRKAAFVVTRDVVTLDLDNIPAGQTEQILKRIKGLGAAYCVYSTRRHHPAEPRLRVLFPLDRACNAEEYEPIARKLAEMVGIELADPTTFEASRLMFWPSVSSDSVYVYEVGAGAFASASGILGLYKDWQDITEWPQVPGASEAIRKRAERQQDPQEKKGVIGAFCRNYSIPEAMERFIPEAYVPVDKQSGRYTYTQGSTLGGAVLYDDEQFLYSHHATDPCSGILVNAFDLVRLHRFGEADEAAKPDTPVNKLPSFEAMCALAMAEEAVTKTMKEERYAESLRSFNESSGLHDIKPEGDTSWMQKLDISATGNYAKTTKNIYVILNHDPALAGKIAFDEFSNRGLALGALPWDRRDVARDWGDPDDAGLRQYLETVYDIAGREKIADALTNTAMLHKFNDVKAYLQGLKWDGTPRIDTVLIDYFGAEDSVYTRAVGRKFFAAGAARVFDPGIKFDYMLILAGPQGCGKSTFLNRIGKRWYSDSLNSFDGKEASEAIQGIWVVEVGELNGLNRSEVNGVKQFLSKRDDVFREAYGRRTVRFRRRCIFAGTTNESAFLRDRTGNRRFWPVDLIPELATHDIFDGLTDSIVDQLWAEGLTAWQVGEELFLKGEAEKQALEQQEAHKESNPKEGIVSEFLDKPLPLEWQSMSIGQRRSYLNGGHFLGDESEKEGKPRDRVCAAEVWVECFNSDLKWMQRRDAVEINSILDYLPNWEKMKSPGRFGSYGKQRGYERV